MSCPVANLALNWARFQAGKYNLLSPSRLLLYEQQRRGIKAYKIKTLRSMYWRGRSFDRAKYPEPRRDEIQEWSYRSEIYAFSRRLQENLNETTLRQIFAHPSYIEVLRKKESALDLPSSQVESNVELVERGSELMDLTVKPYLRCTFDQVPEDGIIAITNYLKSESVMADIAKWLGCKDIILTGEWPPTPRVMADTVLALLSGIEKDLGYERARRFVIDMIISYINDRDILDEVWVIPNPKETLNHILANSKLSAYEPRIMFQTGIKTLESCYIVGLYTDQMFLGSSPGETLDIAEECAAIDALKKLFGLQDNRPPMIYGEKSEQIDYKPHGVEHVYLKDLKVASPLK